MDILVIGNGFDLAHGLPTGYTDFLAFCRMIKKVYSIEENGNADEIWDELGIGLKTEKNTGRVKKLFSQLYSIAYNTESGDKEACIKTDTIYDEFYENIKGNTWLEYFWQCPSYIGEKWIDFESEMSRVIKALEDGLFQVESGGSIRNIEKSKEPIIISLLKAAKASLQNSLGSVTEIEKFIVFLNSELERFIRALEIYVAEFVNDIFLREKNVDIENLKPDHVVTFNYSDTYERVYGTSRKVEYDYIHGEAKITNSIETNNMVLGIDEYLLGNEKNENVKFIAFKKYYQRIYKQTGCKYKEWVDDIEAKILNKKETLRKSYPSQIPYNWFNNEEKNNVYIFGHSLDVTDGDILRDLILHDNVKTTIFYHVIENDNGRKDLGEKIANLVKVIGQDELIRRTGGSTKTIEFKLQEN